MKELTKDKTMNNYLLKRITINPDILHGKPCIRNKRYAVEYILSYLAGGDTIETLLDEFTDLEREDILACLEFASRQARRPASRQARRPEQA